MGGADFFFSVLHPGLQSVRLLQRSPFILFYILLSSLQIIDAHVCKGGRIGTVASSLAEASVPAPMNTADGAVWENVFQEYFKERKTNTDAIADLALENFEEVKFQ